MGESITFLASIAPLQSGMMVDGAGNGMRLKIDVPESEMPVAVRLLAWRQKRLRITIVPDDDAMTIESTDGEHRAIGRRAAKKRIEQGSPGGE